ncbi:hypothetical protein BHE74_00022308 [Ensete ventricosum]|nr:hypothetical protein BHE74_00022308 [Ensete ventricosum]RZR99133.1 hypothetical protein BHM03_00028620 [Ensete ventricosum]
MASASGPPAMALQSSEMLSRDQLLDLFARFDSLTSQPVLFPVRFGSSDVKRRIADAVKDKQVLICPVSFLVQLHEQLDKANFDSSAAVLTSDQIEEIIRRRQIAAKTST